MDWREIYKDKIVTVDEAVKIIKNDSRIYLGHVVSFPKELENALVKNKDQYKNVEINHMFTFSDAAFCNIEMIGHFKYNTFFAGASTRKAIEENRADFTPCFFYKIPELYKRMILKIDVAIVQLSIPNEEGYCSFGLNCDCTKPATESAEIVIAEFNDQMPYVYGDNLIHISDLDYIVESSYPIMEVPSPKIGEVERMIGKNCADLIDDGSTLQLGIGAIPDAVLMFLKDKKDLGIHSEMISDGVLDLIELGVINGSKKTLHEGDIIATFLMGSKRLYNFVNKNEKVKLFPVDYVNNPLTIMKNYKMVSINSCIEVDFSGQVASESVGMKQFSGVGGQVDYIRGTSMAVDGKSIIAVPSTAQNGAKSRIVPNLTDGAFVTTSRNDVDYIVTEYGIAKLSGKSISDRAKSLISIAHPKFRKYLTKEYEIFFN